MSGVIFLPAVMISCQLHLHFKFCLKFISKTNTYAYTFQKLKIKCYPAVEQGKSTLIIGVPKLDFSGSRQKEG